MGALKQSGVRGWPQAMERKRDTGPSAATVKAETHADVKWKEKRDLEDEERRQTELRGAHDDLKKCFKAADYMGAATAQRLIDALTTAKPCSLPRSVTRRGGEEARGRAPSCP